MNAEFQRIARRDKKAILGDQSKEIEENNRVEKPRDLFKKIRDIKGTFHAKMGSIKDSATLEHTLLLCKARLQTQGASPQNHTLCCYASLPLLH